MIRRLIVVALVLAGLATPAAAAPTVAPGDGATVGVRIETPRGSYFLRLLASAPAQGGDATLRVRLERSTGAERSSAQPSSRPVHALAEMEQGTCPLP